MLRTVVKATRGKYSGCDADFLSSIRSNFFERRLGPIAIAWGCRIRLSFLRVSDDTTRVASCTSTYESLSVNLMGSRIDRFVPAAHSSVVSQLPWCNVYTSRQGGTRNPQPTLTVRVGVTTTRGRRASATLPQRDMSHVLPSATAFAWANDCTGQRGDCSGSRLPTSKGPPSPRRVRIYNPR